MFRDDCWLPFCRYQVHGLGILIGDSKSCILISCSTGCPRRRDRVVGGVGTMEQVQPRYLLLRLIRYLRFVAVHPLPSYFILTPEFLVFDAFDSSDIVPRSLPYDPLGMASNGIAAGWAFFKGNFFVNGLCAVGLEHLGDAACWLQNLICIGLKRFLRVCRHLTCVSRLQRAQPSGGEVLRRRRGRGSRALHNDAPAFSA